MIDYFLSTYLASPTLYTIKAYLIYYIYICAASLILPGKKVKGHPEPKRGPQLQYTINGFRLTLLTISIVLLFGGILPKFSQFALFRAAGLAQSFWPLWSTVNIWALLVSIFLYLKGKLGISILKQDVDRHSHGSFGLDFWVGRQLNPRIGSFDIKLVAYRVAMLFWLVLNLSFLGLQSEKQGITFRMIAYQIFTGWYVLDYFWNQQKMLTTWDIISQQFGYMLVFGDYVFIPFAFSVQCHYLINYPQIQLWLLIPISVVFLGGYILFRKANSQKNQFKTNPTMMIAGKKPQLIGGKLLCSGLWGVARHINYTGDLLMSLSYCLPCGFQIPAYFYAFYLFTLLTHRAYRDDAKCSSKYKNLWNQYVGRVKYLFVPFQPLDKPLRLIGKTLYELTNPESIKKQ